MYQSEELLGSVVAASVENPKIQIKYSDAIYSKNNVPFGFKYIFDFSALRMEPVKEDFIKSLLQVANKLATEYGYPKEVIAHIMKFVDPYSYMETCSMYQPDGQHITPLLGWDSAHESVEGDLT